MDSGKLSNTLLSISKILLLSFQALILTLILSSVQLLITSSRIFFTMMMKIHFLTMRFLYTMILIMVCIGKNNLSMMLMDNFGYSLIVPILFYTGNLQRKILTISLHPKCIIRNLSLSFRHKTM